MFIELAVHATVSIMSYTLLGTVHFGVQSVLSYRKAFKKFNPLSVITLVTALKTSSNVVARLSEVALPFIQRQAKPVTSVLVKLL